MESFQGDFLFQSQPPRISFPNASLSQLHSIPLPNQHRSSNPQSFPCQKLKKLLPHSLQPCLNLFSNFYSGSTNAFLSDTAEKLKKLKKKRENSNPSTIQAIKFSKKFRVFLPGNVVMFGILKQSKQEKNF
jgi:hypothetical protein